MHVVICGGGAIGACAAYFLARRGVDVTVVERTGIACAASGKAGALLALDWCAGSPVDALARRSFALHAELASRIDDDWAYHRTHVYGGRIARDHETGRQAPAMLDWLRPGIEISHRLGTPDTTAVIHPGKFTAAMVRAAQKLGARVHAGQVTGVDRRGAEGIVAGVHVDGSLIEADATVIAMGPWSVRAAEWLALPAVRAQQTPSIVYATGTDVPAHALFLQYPDGAGDELTIEVFPRADGSTHVCAFSTDVQLPLDPADVAPDPHAMERLGAMCERLSPAFSEDRVIAKQACFRPFARDYVPLIGRVPRTASAYVATGHNVWGILNAPATGEAMSELIVDGKAHTVDLSAFDPGRPIGR